MITVQDALSKGYGEWRSFTCPVHEDRSPSARVHVMSGVWVCMSCGAKGKYGSEDIQIPDEVVFREVSSLTGEEPITFLPDTLMSLYEVPGRYWRQRFTDEACLTWQLGHDTYTDAAVYPVRDFNGRLLGVVQRVDDGRTKYKYPKGFKSTQHLFGAHKIKAKEPLVVVEGAPDVVALWEVGIPAVGTYGSDLHPTQIGVISAFEPSHVICAYDKDRAGRLGGMRAVAELGMNGIMAERARWAADYKDVGEMPREYRAEVFST